MYEGDLGLGMDPQGVGTIVDDEFNFITCSDWQNGRINGPTFIKLANETIMWGHWAHNLPVRHVCVKIGCYFMVLPYNESKVQRPKKCIIVHEGKAKVYLAVIEKN